MWSDRRNGRLGRYRFFYGPRMWTAPAGFTANMAMRQQNAVVGKGESLSSFVHINDAAIATVAALTAGPGMYTTLWMMTFRRRSYGCLHLRVCECSRASAYERRGGNGKRGRGCGVSRDEAERVLECEGEADSCGNPGVGVAGGVGG